MTKLLNNRYRVIRTLGKGGFGETFLAEDTHMPSGRSCVIKQLQPNTNDPQVYQLIQERFQREAAILEELGAGSSQIPQLYAYFAEAGQFYLIQELVEGITLGDWLQQQGIQKESSVQEILVSLLPVLSYVHNKGIIHRDIKPENIILRSTDRQPVLIDFGAVRETMGTMMNSQGNSTSSIVIGTPGFMPSEQAAGRPVYASDIYALGLTAIYLLTGKIPQNLASDPITGEILWRQEMPQVSPSFAKVLDKAIFAHARDRFSTAQEMLAALQNSSEAIPPTVTAPPHIPSPQKGVILAITVAGILIGASIFCGFIISRSPQQQPPEESKLVSLLEMKDWQAADIKTLNTMLKTAGREIEGKLTSEDIALLPCSELEALDKMWVDSSSGHFGFSVQTKIYEQLARNYQAYFEQVGWKINGVWVDYDKLTFNMDAPRGQLPHGGKNGYSSRDVFNKVKSCNLN